MESSLSLAQEKFQKYLPFLREVYPSHKKNKSALREIANIYKAVQFPSNVLVGLYCQQTASFFYLSDSSEQFSGYAPEEVLKWGGLVGFKVLHYSHYSFMYRILKEKKAFNQKVPIADRKSIEFFCCGLRMMCKDGQQKRVFLKTKNLELTDSGKPEITVAFMEDISLLLKGTHYWNRLKYKNHTYAYANKRGKKEFQDILSTRELEIARLLAEQKSTLEISELLKLSQLTIQTHRKNMLKRTGAVDTSALLQICKMANVF